MKKHLLLLPAVAGLLLRCQGSDNKTPSHETPSENLPSTQGPLVTCYAYTQRNDTISLQLKTSGAQATGDLVYKLFGKDRNRGTLQGQFRGDTLFAVYTFLSEGVQSEREVVFLRQGDSLTEGFGEVTDAGGKMQFADRQKLSFGNVVLQEVPCRGDAVFSVTGTIGPITRGKDGYTATLTATDGEQYQAVISWVNMVESGAYEELHPGNQVTLYGDTTRLGDTISIKVAKIER